MENTLLYKYRGIQSFKYFVDIIMKNRLYASNYKELNDPMEGQFYYNKGELNPRLLQKLSNGKGSLRVCSLSRKNNSELMWSHYAEGQHGVAIGVEIDRSKYRVHPIHYNGLAYLVSDNLSDETAIEILTHKLEIWNYEQEERIFVTGVFYVDVTVKEVITGRAMSQQDYSLIKEMVSLINPGIPVIKAETIMDEGTFVL